jgi:hypothetical protein
LIALLCAFTALLGASAWIAARQRWERMDAADPKKQFAQEVFDGLNSAMPWASPNGSRWQAATHQVWVRLASRNHPQGCRRQSEQHPNDEHSGNETSGVA